jgi:hypothetical protein
LTFADKLRLLVGAALLFAAPLGLLYAAVVAGVVP